MARKKIIPVVIAVVFLAAVGAVFVWYQSANSNGFWQNLATSGSQIVVEPEFYDLGTVIYGEVARHSFNVNNTGDEPLEILRLSTSCGCTQAAMKDDQAVIAPGETAEMVVSFDPAVHQDDTDLGELTRVVYIRTNDASQPETEVTIKANVVKQ